MITRIIDREDSNLAIIKQILCDTQEFVCTIQLIENEVLIQENHNIVFPPDAFVLTDEELEELGVKYTEFEELTQE